VHAPSALHFEIICRAAGAQGARHGAPAADARGDLPRPPRPPVDAGEDEARPEARRRITACAAEATQAGGAYAGYGIITILYTGALMHGLYDIPAIKHDAWRVYTNTAALRRDARPRHGGHPRRLRGAARPRWPRSSASIRWRCASATCCRRSPTARCTPRGAELRPAGVPGEGQGGLGLGERKGKLPKGRGLGHGAVRTSSRARPRPSTGPANRTPVST
jgi:4-hydroxybenzoyl-CoA reductase subunit alpha